jgi:small subunit ribosomal protein S4
MGRYIGPVCKLCRREGMRLFLKGERCFSPKCSVEKRSYPAGMHGPQRQFRRKASDYSLQLREKQKARRFYGVFEKQFRRYFAAAERHKGLTGTNLLIALETRLDNVVFHLGFANTRAAARQMVAHGHVRVNGRKVSIPSFSLKVNNVVEIKNTNVSRQLATKNLESATSRAVPDWLSLNKEEFKGLIMRIPTRDEINPIANEQAVVEFYSR